ncbi:MAG TPA: zinc ABC transporter substrate-binding protein [Bacteroidales bacterium]|nr:zinc ABC transporter substrate-binding protein [Bacteroidales bacterium]
MTKNLIYIFLFFLIVSCGRKKIENNTPVITVSIAPYKYFIDKIAGNDFRVNIMVPPGSDPHSYEPLPEQISDLRNSMAYVSNGFLGFEMTWLDRFYEVNNTMQNLSLGEYIEPLGEEHHHERGHSESADPHYWVSPVCAKIMAARIKDFLIELNPSGEKLYESNYEILDSIIGSVENRASELFSDYRNSVFMIYHPNLGYLARDYGLEEIAVEYEGKEPPPSRMKYLIDRARKENIKIIFVQKEYDKKNAISIADEIGAELKVIDPLSEDWESTTLEIITSVYMSFTLSRK